MLASGVSASPGAAKGAVVFTAADAVQAAEDGRDVILVRPFTEADDVAGFHAAKGILTIEGGKASHAALVARGMGRPAVVGADELAIDLEGEDDPRRRPGDRRGRPDRDRRHRAAASRSTTSRWSSRRSTRTSSACWSGRTSSAASGVRANADTPGDAKRARELGAEGIGLCRTEHMFMAEDRQPKMRAMIMADDTDAPPRGAGRAAAAPAGGLRGAVRGDGRAPGDDPAARPAAARVPQEPARPARAGRARADRGSPTTSSSWRRRSRGWRRSTRRTRCSAPAAAGWGS